MEEKTFAIIHSTTNPKGYALISFSEMKRVGCRNQELELSDDAEILNQNCDEEDKFNINRITSEDVICKSKNEEDAFSEYIAFLNEGVSPSLSEEDD